MKKVLFTLIAIVLLSTSCLNAPTGGSTTGTKYDATQDAKIAALEGIILGPNGLQAIVGNIQSKISGISDVPSLLAKYTALDARVTSVEGRVGTSTGGVTQAQLDALSARIKSIEDWKAGLPSGGSSGGTPAVAGVIDADGDLQLILEREKEDEVWIDDNVAETWRLTVKNNGTSSTYFRINADFDCEESVAITKATLTPAFSYSTTITTSPAEYVPATPVTSLPWLVTSASGNKIYIGKSREESLYLTLKVDYTTDSVGKLWTWNFSIRDLGG